MLKIWHRRWFLKQRQLKRKMHGGRLHAILGRHVFHRKVWRSDKRAIAGGLAVGLFMAFAPTIPFQMLLAAAAAIYFKVNLPLALAACWVCHGRHCTPRCKSTVYTANWTRRSSSGPDHK